MIVVGGSYHESVIIPAYEGFLGSGIRAAGALASTGCSLVSAVDVTSAAIAATATATLGIAATTVERDQPVRFGYMTPMSAPVIDGPSATLRQPLMADDEVVLAFGMVEHGVREVRGSRVVLDPQQPRGLEGLATEGIRADQLVVVANAREVRALAQGESDLLIAAQRVASQTNSVAVVVKDSARGCLVVSPLEGKTERVGPFPTESVWPLGSGDVFAAGFAHAWQRGADFVEAARVGGASTAWWCTTMSVAVPPRILSGDDPGTVHAAIACELSVPDREPVVYLAAPFFSLGQRWLVETCRNALAGMNVRVFSPLHDVGAGGDDVAARDLEGLADCDAVLALIDGWDPGTLYEIGWARQRQLPVIGLLNSVDDEGTKMLVGTGVELHQDLSSALYRAAWAAQGAPVQPRRVRSRMR